MFLIILYINTLTRYIYINYFYVIIHAFNAHLNSLIKTKYYLTN